MFNFKTHLHRTLALLAQRPMALLGVLLLPTALLVPTTVASSEGPNPQDTVSVGQGEVHEEQGTLSPVEPVKALPQPELVALSCTHCLWLQSTPPVTKVGATCLRARQKAATAARALASFSTGICSMTHSVAPCQPITNGFSATAVATYRCKNPKFCS